MVVTKTNNFLCDQRARKRDIISFHFLNFIIELFQLADLSTGTHSSVGAWFGGGVTGLYPSRDGTRLAVTYTSNVMRWVFKFIAYKL